MVVVSIENVVVRQVVFTFQVAWLPSYSLPIGQKVNVSCQKYYIIDLTLKSVSQQY